jgi:hypothetical protein
MLFYAAENFQLMSDFEAEERMARKMLAVYKFYPRLVSYAFKDMAETVFRLKRLEDISDRVVVIADSGAYTEMKQDKKIDLDDYIEWVQENEKSIYRCVNLDKIGDGLKSFQNYCYMRECDLNPIPVWHLGTEIEYLLEYLKMTDYIGISLRKNSRHERKRILELDPLWHYFLTDDYKLPLANYHLFGVQSVPIITRYPLYDLSVRICDLDKFDEVGDQYTFEALDYIYEDIDIGNLIGARLIKTWSLDPNKINRYNIFFSARNGFFTQQLRYQVVNDKWVKANKVTKDEKTLLEEIDKEYPRNEKGEVEW